MYMKCRPTSIFAVRSNIQKLFKDLCTMILLDTIGNRRGYLCYQNFFDLRHNIVLFHFSIFLAFRLLSVMLTPRWPSLLLEGSTTNPLSRLPTTCSCLFPKTTLVWLDFIPKLANDFALNFSLSHMDMPSFQGCSSPSLTYEHSWSAWSNTQS